MTFWQIFLRVLPWRPLAALKSLWWHTTGRKVRARNRLRAAGAQLPFAYRVWIRATERPEELKQAAQAASTWPRRPSFSILLHVGPEHSGDLVERSLNSARRQLYPHWTLSITTKEPLQVSGAGGDDRIRIVERVGEVGGGSLADQFRQAPGDFIVPLQAGDELSSCALFRFAEALQSEPAAKILYGDHDQLDSMGQRTSPWFKPRWNEEMFLARDYLSGAVAIRVEAVRSLAPEIPKDASLYEMLLILVRAGTGPIVHVPYIVAHLRADHRLTDQKNRVEAVGRHVAAAGATAAAGPFDTVKVCWPLPAKLPLASIIVPTRDKIELLRPCVESVLARTDYDSFEIIIIDNGSVEERTARYLDEIAVNPRVRVLSYPGPYNYSAINNYAAREAKGAYLCLLNNDTEVIESQWLTEMMRYAVRPEIGAVGAKLLYADRTIQHAGVIIGIGNAAGHAHRNLPDTEAGYFSQVHTAHFVSAVTGACLLVSKEKFMRVGGLDEERLAVAYNDVDLCLKLERAGWRNVYVPHAVLIHHESRSRGKDHSPSQINRYRHELRTFQERWGATTYQDPLLNPNLDRSSETFLIRL